MTQITIDVKPETQQHIHTMLSLYPAMTFGQVAGMLLDCQIAYRIEVERMKPATVDSDHPFGGGY